MKYLYGSLFTSSYGVGPLGKEGVVAFSTCYSITMTMTIARPTTYWDKGWSVSEPTRLLIPRSLL